MELLDSFKGPELEFWTDASCRKSVHEKCWMGMCLNLAEDFSFEFLTFHQLQHTVDITEKFGVQLWSPFLIVASLGFNCSRFFYT